MAGKEDKMFREESKAPLKKYTINGKTFTENDFKNPIPVEKRSIEYSLAYSDWQADNGLLIEFNNMGEVDEWFRELNKKYNFK